MPIAADNIVHGVLTPTVVETVTLNSNFRSVEILNRDGSAEIYLVVDKPDVEPTVGGEDCEVLPASQNAIELPSPASGQTTVKLISDGGPAFSVKGILA